VAANRKTLTELKSAGQSHPFGVGAHVQRAVGVAMRPLYLSS
jgi:hypothetical protein